MKLPLLTGYTFQAATRTLDLSGVPNFDVRRLLGVFDLTANADVYLPGEPGYGFASVTGGVIRLQADTSRLADSDILAVFYDDGTGPLGVNAATADRQDAANSRLAAILAAIQAQRVETIWTDDTGVRFIRVDIGGSIVWTDVAGNATSAPGTGARPDSDSGTVVSRSTYRATAAGTGFASGDVLDHLVVTDGDAGDLVSNFWINVTAGTRIAAPSAASISPLAPLPDGAATGARQDTGNTSLAALTTGIGAPADAVATSDAGAFGLIALAKRGLVNWTTLLGRVTGAVALDATVATGNASLTSLTTTSGTPTDTAYAGTGPASVVSGLKGLYARLGAVVLAAGTAVIGKVGLQVAGADVALTNPVPVRFGTNTTYGQDASGQIGAGARFDGPLKASDARYGYFNAAFQADKAATANIYASVDGGATAGVLVWSKTLAAGEAATVKVPILFSHFQASFTAGAAPATIQMNSGFSVT